MEKKGFVRRSENPVDRRRSDISLTDAGAQLEAELVPIAMDLIAQVSAGINPGDLEAVGRTLRLLQENIIHRAND